MACVRKRRGRWVIDFYDQEGTRCWKTMPQGATKDDANEEMGKLVTQVKQKAYRAPKETPLFETVAKEWLDFKKTKIRITTWETYEGHVKNHFPCFDEKRMDLVTVADVEGFISGYEEKGTPIGTIRKVLVTLNQILSFAVRRNYATQNPLLVAERPKANSTDQGVAEINADDIEAGKADSEAMQILTPSQIRAFLDAEKELKYNTLFRLAVFAGLRQGELLGLRWQDIDWKASQIWVRRTYNKGRFFDPKTKESKRRVDIGPEMLKRLKEWKLACPVNDLDLLFPNDFGKPMNYSNMVNRQFKPALLEAKAPDIRFHDLRHTFASLLIDQGENIKYIQTQLGHSSPTVTLSVYAHKMKDSNPEAAQRLEDTVWGVDGSKMVAASEKAKKESVVNA